MTHTVELQVQRTGRINVFRDRARIPEAQLGSIREGRICKVSVGPKSALLEIRNFSKPGAIIRLDARTRDLLEPLNKSLELPLAA